MARNLPSAFVDSLARPFGTLAEVQVHLCFSCATVVNAIGPHRRHDWRTLLGRSVPGYEAETARDLVRQAAEMLERKAP